MKKLGILVLMAFLLIASVSAVTTMTRSVPSTATAGSNFTVTYTVSGTGTWGASIVDNVAGGCKFPDGTNQLKTVMLSSDGNTKTVTVTAPSSGSCTFTGDSKFGIDLVVAFPTGTTTISGTCTPSCYGKVCGDNGCGESCGTCASGTVCSNGQCITTCPAGQTLCSDGICKESCEIEETTVCNEFFSKTMNWFSFTDNDCSNGYLTGILVVAIVLIIVILIKK